jgi:hypothetical protein
LKVLASGLQILGLIALALSVGAISLVAGGVVAGIEMVLLGLALERR